MALPEQQIKVRDSSAVPNPVRFTFCVWRRYAVDSDGQLVIPKMSQNDEGWYSCRASSGEEYASQVKVACKVAPSRLIPAETVLICATFSLNLDLNDFSKTGAIDPPPPHSNGYHYFAEYSSVELTCIAPEGLPVPAVWWEGPNGRILTVPTRSESSVLSLSRVLAEDAGIYSCKAENSVRKLTVPVNVVVTGTTPRSILFFLHNFN